MFQKVIDHVNRKKAGIYLIAESEGKRMESEAKAKASWTDRTGNTRNSIHGGADRNTSGATLYLAHGSKVGGYLEEGTGIYGPKGRPIRPVKAKALAFKVDGQWVITKEVKGMKARPIIKPTAQKNIPKLIKALERYLSS